MHTYLDARNQNMQFVSNRQHTIQKKNLYVKYVFYVCTYVCAYVESMLTTKFRRHNNYRN